MSMNESLVRPAPLSRGKDLETVYGDTETV